MLCKYSLAHLPLGQHFLMAVIGYDSDKNRKRFLRAGGDGFLTKPVLQDQLPDTSKAMFKSLKKRQNS